jgi:hypothetical protein
MNTKSLYSSSIDRSKKLVLERRKLEQEYLDKFVLSEYSEIKPITTVLPGKILGVYMMVYLPENKIYYVGNGRIKARINRAKKIFDNLGKILLHPKSASDHCGARKAYKKDSELSNWGITYVEISNRDLREQVEIDLVETIKPPSEE